MGEQPYRGDFGHALFIILALGVAVAVLGWILVFGFNQIGGVVIIYFTGAVQFLYAIPYYFMVRRHAETDSAKGIVVGACIVILLNGICDGVVRFH